MKRFHLAVLFLTFSCIKMPVFSAEDQLTEAEVQEERPLPEETVDQSDTQEMRDKKAVKQDKINHCGEEQRKKTWEEVVACYIDRSQENNVDENQPQKTWDEIVEKYLRNPQPEKKNHVNKPKVFVMPTEVKQPVVQTKGFWQSVLEETFVQILVDILLGKTGSSYSSSQNRKSTYNPSGSYDPSCGWREPGSDFGIR